MPLKDLLERLLQEVRDNPDKYPVEVMLREGVYFELPELVAHLRLTRTVRDLE
jgi:nitrogen fixation protein